MQAPGPVQRGSGEGSEGSREGLGGFTEPGHVPQGSGEGRRFREALVQSQVTFNREKVPEKAWEALV